MQRSKQQAMMFLLGAVLVGGVLGFSADRVMGKSKPSFAQRVTLYKELGVTTEQRVKIDSLLDESNCKIAELWKPIKPAMDSLITRQKQDWLAVLTKEQRAKLDAREARFKAQRDSMEKARAARGPSDRDKSGTDHPTRKCGGGSMRGPGMGPGGPGGPGPSGAGGGPDHRGPGGPFHF